MQTYETIFIAAPTLTEQEELETVEAMAEVVTQGGGTFTANDRMGRRRLAYPILKHQDGVYVRFLYDAEADVPKELERRVRLSDRLLRSLTVRLEPNWAVAAKEQAVRDAQARVEAAEREKVEAAAAAEREKLEAAAAAEAAARGEVEPASETETVAAPTEVASSEAPTDDSEKPDDSPATPADA
jgi:small subunit ribosomal protein S6